MGKFEVKSPINSERFMMEVSIPMTDPSIVTNSIELEQYFIKLRDSEVTEAKKVEYDRGRALVKYASACGALIFHSQYDRNEKRLYIIFTFSTFEGLLDFKNNLLTCVNGAMH